MEKEIWKDIKNYKNLYQVSNFGRVKRLRRKVPNKGCFGGSCILKEKILTPRVNLKRFGYCEISLHKEGKEKRFKVHRLVAEAFIPNPDNYPQVNHIDGDKQNNSVTNLEWCTCKQNMYHAWQTGLMNANHRKRAIICNETGVIYESVAEASKTLKIDRRGLFRVLSKTKKSIKNMTFDYVVYRGFCPEMKSCNYDKTEEFQKELKQYRDTIKNEER